jgi:hypothetical protein
VERLSRASTSPDKFDTVVLNLTLRALACSGSIHATNVTAMFPSGTDTHRVAGVSLPRSPGISSEPSSRA